MILKEKKIEGAGVNIIRLIDNSDIFAKQYDIEIRDDNFNLVTIIEYGDDKHVAEIKFDSINTEEDLM